MSNSQIPQISENEVVGLLIQFLTNRPKPISPAHLYALQNRLEQESRARLHEVTQNVEKSGRGTIRPFNPTQFIEEPLTNTISSADETANIVGFILALKKSEEKWHSMVRMVQNFFGAQKSAETVSSKNTLGSSDGVLGGKQRSGEQQYESFLIDETPSASTEDEIKYEESRLHELRKELNDLKTANFRLKRALDQGREETTSLNREFDALKNERSALEQEKKDLSNAIEILGNRLTEARQIKDALLDQIAQEKQSLLELESNALSAAEEAAEKKIAAEKRMADAEIASNRASLLIAKAERIEMEAREKTNEAGARISVANETLERDGNAISLVQEMDKIGISEDLRQKLKPEVDETVRYNAAVYALSLIRESAIKLSTRVREEVRNLEEECRRLDNQRMALKENIQNAGDDRKTLAVEYEQLSTYVSDLDDNLAELRAAIADRQKLLSQAELENSQSEAMVRSRFSELIKASDGRALQLKAAEADHEREKNEQEARIAEFQRLTRDAVATAEEKARNASSSCAQKVLELEKMAVEAKQRYDSESACLTAAIEESEEALAAIKQNARRCVEDVHNKAAALVGLVQEVQDYNLSGLEQRLEEMEQYASYFGIVMQSLIEAKERVDGVFEQSRTLNETYAALKMMRQKEADDIRQKMDRALAVVEQICPPPREDEALELTEADIQSET